MNHLVVIDPGMLTLVQDLGRGSHASQGVARAGAADLASHALAQRLCGNRPTAAGLEVLLGGLRLRTAQACIMAVTGALVEVSVDGVLQGINHAFAVPAGSVLALSQASIGMRAYVAVRGGLAVAEVLGSRSRDTLGGLGPAPLAATDMLPIGDHVAEPAWLDIAAVRAPSDSITLTIAPGPHDDILGASGWKSMLQTEWHIDSRSDRIGFRLAGPALAAPASDIASFPVLAGCVQLPGDGRPMILGPDCGVTGGYPVLGMVSQEGLDALAQARPGNSVRFRRSN